MEALRLGVSGQQWSGRPHIHLAFPRFEEENQRLLELNQRCQFATSATMQWLDIRLQLMGAAVVSAIAGIALVQHQQGLANPGATQDPLTPTSPASWSTLLPDLSLHFPPNIFASHQGFLVRVYHDYHHHPRLELSDNPQVVVAWGLE